MEFCVCTCTICGVVILLVFVMLYSAAARKKYLIKGKHILVTGGSSGIGKAVAREALQRGASHVTLVARNKVQNVHTIALVEIQQEKLHSVKQELTSLYHNQTVDVISIDVGEPDAETKIRDALSDMPPVDVVVNSAGITHTASLLETSREVFQSLFNTNIMGSVAVTRAVLPTMKDRQTGHIVFIDSQAGQFPFYGYSAYGSSKFALRGLAEVLAMELQPYNIHVSISFPPDTDTPQLHDEAKYRTPMIKELASYGTVLKPEQVASEILTGIERQQYAIHHGFDGFMLKILTAGTAPVSSLLEVVTQIFLMGLFRFVALGYLFQFNRIVARHLKKKS